MSKLKVLLVNPPVKDFFYTPMRSYPLNILSLATVLNWAGIKVKVVNFPYDFPKKIIFCPEEFNYLKKYYKNNKSPFCLFNHYYCFGDDQGVFSHILKEFSPDIVGISANFFPYCQEIFQLAKRIKKVDSRILIVLGGRAATYDPQFFLSRPEIDVLVKGEAEEVFLSFCKNFQEEKKAFDLPGVCWRNGQKVKIDPRVNYINNLNDLPVINHQLIEKKYYYYGRLSVSTYASRGCLNNCEFCPQDRNFRWRSLEHLRREIELCKKLNIEHISFEDDAINFHPEFKQIVEMFQEQFSSMSFSFNSGFFAGDLKGEYLDKLKKSNLTHLDFSWASLKNDYQREKLIINLKELSLSKPINLHFILGYPKQKAKEIIRFIRHFAKFPIYLGPSIFYPVPGTDLFKKSKLAEISTLAENYIYFRSSAAYSLEGISHDELFTFFYLCRIINFIKKIADKFKTTQEDFFSWVMEHTARRIGPNEILPTNSKLKKEDIGLILLAILAENKVIARVEENYKQSKFYYLFYEEKFIIKDYLNATLDNLEIFSLNNRRLRLIWLK